MLDKERVDEAEVNVKGYLRDGLLKKRVLEIQFKSINIYLSSSFFKMSFLRRQINAVFTFNI